MQCTDDCLYVPITVALNISKLIDFENICVCSISCL